MNYYTIILVMPMKKNVSIHRKQGEDVSLFLVKKKRFNIHFFFCYF